MSDLPDLPAAPGAYALILELPQALSIPVGRLGPQVFSAGIYAYLGSALGPGGLRARINHHRRGGKPHWHVDRLRPVTRLLGVIYLPLIVDPGPAVRLECAWAQVLAGLPGASCPAPGFGASDCRANCPAHLVRLPGWDASILSALTAASPAGALPQGVTTGRPVTGGSQARNRSS